MRTRLVLVAFALCLSASPGAADAAGNRSRTNVRNQRQVQGTVTRSRPRQRPRRTQDAAALQRKREKAIAKKFLKGQKADRRKAARFFEKITVKRDYSGEYVMMRNNKVTAFLDLADPRHPSYDPGRKSADDKHMADIPKPRRVHVLVVPNAKREHIATSLGAQIGRGDLEKTLSVVKEAEKLAAQLKLKQPRVFVNSESNIGVGYLHVHITGERTAQTRYPSALK